MPEAVWGAPPFKEAVEAFRQKAFRVSGVMGGDVLAGLRESIDRAVAEGESFGQFKKSVRSIMEKRGWAGLAPYRIDNIFRTNVQVAYQAGHYARQMQTVDARPYWQYVAVMDGRTRPAHRAAHGMVFRYDDPFWSSNYPPNGYRCRCTVRSLSEVEAEREKLTISTNGPRVADEGWDHNPALEVPGAGRTPKVAKAGLAARFPVRKYSDIETLMREFDRENPGLFEKGAPKLEVKNTGKAFMATNCHGRITLFNHSFWQCDNFNAARDLKSALSKLGKGKKLLFHDEYAIESLWHEVGHNTMKGADLYMHHSILPYQLMETVNQFCARHTYGEFMEKLGGVAVHGKEVLERGYGYSSWVRNMRSLIARLGCKEDKVLAEFRRINTEGKWRERVEDVEGVLARHQTGRHPEQSIRTVLGGIPMQSREQFEELMEATLGAE